MKKLADWMKSSTCYWGALILGILFWIGCCVGVYFYGSAEMLERLAQLGDAMAGPGLFLAAIGLILQQREMRQQVESTNKVIDHQRNEEADRIAERAYQSIVDEAEYRWLTTLKHPIGNVCSKIDLAQENGISREQLSQQTSCEILRRLIPHFPLNAVKGADAIPLQEDLSEIVEKLAIELSEKEILEFLTKAKPTLDSDSTKPDGSSIRAEAEKALEKKIRALMYPILTHFMDWIEEKEGRRTQLRDIGKLPSMR